MDRALRRSDGRSGRLTGPVDVALARASDTTLPFGLNILAVLLLMLRGLRSTEGLLVDNGEDGHPHSVHDTSPIPYAVRP